MRRILRLAVVILFSIIFLSCRQPQTNPKLTNSNAQLEIMYFHTSQRCTSCIAIENNTRKVLEEKYKTQFDSGIILFTSFNIDEKANTFLIEKYQISYLTLLIIKADGTKTDFTNTAFQYVESKPEKFEELLIAEIDKNLK